jgi:transcriptional regulator with XRE-family HTH domain
MKDKARPQRTPDPGPALRAVRLRRDLTLADVSRRTGLPLSTLSKLENGKMSLSYDKLVRLSKGLEIDIAELLATEPAEVTSVRIGGRRSITRANHGGILHTENYLHVFPANDLLNKRFVPIVAELRARSLKEFGPLIRHPGEEYTFVLEGAVELHSELYAPVRLAVGDSIYFDSDVGHAYLAAAPGRCRVLTICSATESELTEAVKRTGARREEAAAKPARTRRGTAAKKTRK